MVMMMMVLAILQRITILIDIKQPWSVSGGDLQTLEPEIEEFIPCLLRDPSCNQKINQQVFKDIQGMIKEDIEINTNEQLHQEHHNYIELWFEKVTSLENHFQ